jgi:heme A synthase
MLNSLVDQRFRKLTLFSAIMTYVLVVIGGIVRVTGSGLGCPDWPLCYGQPVPPLQAEAVIEMTHRFVAGLVTILVVVVALAAWRNYRNRIWIFRPAVFAVVVVIVQVILGGVTVLLKNAPYTVALHLGTALTLLASMTIVAVVARNEEAVPHLDWRRNRLLMLSLASALLVFLVILVGALVTGSGSALACLDWPLCQGQLIPDTTSPFVYIQWTHRLVALLTGLLLVYLLANVRCGSFRRWRGVSM